MRWSEWGIVDGSGREVAGAGMRVSQGQRVGLRRQESEGELEQNDRKESPIPAKHRSTAPLAQAGSLPARSPSSILDPHPRRQPSQQVHHLLRSFEIAIQPQALQATVTKVEGFSCGTDEAPH